MDAITIVDAITMDVKALSSYLSCYAAVATAMVFLADAALPAANLKVSVHSEGLRPNEVLHFRINGRRKT